MSCSCLGSLNGELGLYHLYSWGLQKQALVQMDVQEARMKSQFDQGKWSEITKQYHLCAYYK